MNDQTHARYMSDIAYFLSKMEEDPSTYILPVLLSYNKLEKYDETISLCEDELDNFQSNCAFKTFLAEAYVYKGIFDKAKPLLIEVTAEDNDNYKALKLLGIIAKSEGEKKEALKYLIGAYIRNPEDEDVKRMIDELGGTLDPSQIYEEKMKRQKEIVLADEAEDDHLKVYEEIDSQIKNAEMIVEELVNDQSFQNPEFFQDDDYIDDNIADSDFGDIEKSIEITENIIANIEENIEEELNTNNEIREIKEIKGINVFINDIKEEEKAEDISVEDNKIVDSKISDLISSLGSEEEEEEEEKVTEEVTKEANIEGINVEEHNPALDLISALSSFDEEEREEEVEGQEEVVEIAENVEVEVGENVQEQLVEEALRENQPEERLENHISIHNMSYEDIIDDDFQYGKIVDDDYADEDILSHDDLGESAPFIQTEIMDEILTVANISSEDMENDEKIEIVSKKEKEDKEEQINRLDSFLKKVTK